MQKDWYVYIVRCADDSLYTGVTTDVQRRLKEHNELAVGAKYTRTRRPVDLVYHLGFADRSAACKEEWRIKQLSRQQKLRLIAKSATHCDTTSER